MQTEFEGELVAHIPHLRAFARFVTQNGDQANDLVQDTIVRALRAKHQYQPGTNFKAWTFTIMRNLHVNNLRRHHNKTESIEDGALDAFAVLPDQHAKIEFQELRRALTKLSREHCEVLILVGASGFQYEEAAKICKCAVGTIKSRLSRARTELQRLMLGTECEAGGRLDAAAPRARTRRLSKTAAALPTP
jgi:RNA polymerase sigma-70 factor (ECF subfamily)